MGVIVAAPTAGSAGVVPGCVLALADHLQLDDEQVMDALYCAAAIGLNLTTSACVAGAEGGCQAEVGSAAAMAAAALVQMLGGTPEQALDASSIALSNLLGLVCDPVGGLVEVPCQNRNAIGVAAAFSSAQLALAGIKSLVPFDQMACSRLATPCRPRCARRQRAASHRLRPHFRPVQNAVCAGSDQERLDSGTNVPPLLNATVSVPQTTR